MSQQNTAVANLEVLRLTRNVEITLNDLRILVGCFKALAYQSQLDGEDYLDVDALALKERLESLYLQSLREAGGNSHTR